LQHEDGHSHLLAYPVPNLITYDPAYAYEIGVIVREGIRRMLHAQEDIFYYMTVANENYAHPPMPGGVSEGILRGMYRFRVSDLKTPRGRVNLLGSGSIFNEALRAAELLEERFGIAADVWSVTSYKQLRADALDTARWNLLHPGEPPRVAYVTRLLAETEPRAQATVAASDYVKALPDSIARWIPGPSRRSEPTASVAAKPAPRCGISSSGPPLY
jgi:pyruvate dehydrogenase E1 component